VPHAEIAQLMKTCKAGAQKLVNHYVALQGVSVATMVRKSVETRDWFVSCYSPAPFFLLFVLFFMTREPLTRSKKLADLHFFNVCFVYGRVLSKKKTFRALQSSYDCSAVFVSTASHRERKACLQMLTPIFAFCYFFYYFYLAGLELLFTANFVGEFLVGNF
jgi:hypothetical protein